MGGERSRHRAAPAANAPFGVLVTCAVAFVLLYVGLSGTGLLNPAASVAVDDAGQLLGGLAATVAFTVTARRAPAGDRVWRWLLAAATGGWTLGMAVWGWYQVFDGVDLPSPSLADLGFFAMPVFALPALWVFPASPGSGNPHSRGLPRPVLVTDTLVVVGSLFLLTWSTALGATLHADSPSDGAFLVALGYAVTDLVLVVFVVLLGTFRRPANPTTLLLLGLGLVAFAISDSLYLYLVGIDAPTMPPLYNIGYVAGPVLMALSALAPSVRPGPRAGRFGRGTDRTAVILPILPVVATMLLLITHFAAGVPIGRLEGGLGTLLVTLVVVRQLVTALHNVSLLHQVRDGQDRLRRQAFTDPLTGLANRTLFSDRLAEAVAGHRDRQAPFAVLFSDLDDFKRINDDHGHAVGDLVLQQVAQRLRECCGPLDTVARLGGDEFAVLLPGEPERAARVGARVVEAIARPVPLAGSSSRHRSSVRTGASVGVVGMARHDTTTGPDALLSLVDSAMYQAKNHGKNRLVVLGSGGPTMDGGAAAVAGLLGDLRLALSSPPQGEGRLDVVYQPVVRIADESVVAVEALVRFDHPHHGGTPAETLVIAAEDAGLIGALETHVLDTACRDLVLMRAMPGQDGLRMHVNLSGRRCVAPELPALVTGALARHGVPADALVLEITETSRILDLPTARRILGQVRAIGVHLALDDFGTGYSGVSYVIDLPIEMIKLDRVLTAAAPSTPAAAVRDAAVRIAADLGLVLVAEGVQTREEVQALARLGCRYAQGYLYAPPGPLTYVPPATATATAPAPATAPAGADAARDPRAQAPISTW